MTWTRRDLIRWGLLLSAHAVLPRRFNWAQRSPDLTPFVDPLPIPPVLPADSRYEINMREVSQKLHRDLPPTRVWAYHGTYPGPTFEVRSGSPIEVEWLNQLPTHHLLPIDDRIHGAEAGVPEVRTVVHLHGAKVHSDSDGHPSAWFTPAFGRTGPEFSRRVYRYPNEQAATALWYHDHALGITRLNVYAGLAGFYLIRDSVEDALALPRGRYEIPLMFQDRSLNADGSLDYPVQGPVSPAVPPIWIPELFGDTALVNGKVMPYLLVEPRKYRFRALNACNARFLNLSITGSSDAHETLGLLQIGTDQGLLPRPVSLPSLVLAPGERADLVIDFSGKDGRRFLVQNDAPAPYPGGGAMGGVPVFLEFRVGHPVSEPDSALPATLTSPPPAPPPHLPTRRLLLSEADDPSGNPTVGLLGTVEKGGLRFHDPITEDPKAGSTEVWELYNTTMDAHPIHLHLVRFQIVDRQPFDLKQFQASGTIVFTGPPEAPAPNERPAWKDIVKALPGDPDAGIGRVTRIVATFELPTGPLPPAGAAQDYMWHCHILEHEDNEMMRPLRVVTPARTPPPAPHHH